MLNRLLKPELRYARRMARIARWDRPLGGFLDRANAFASMLFVDHGIFRVIYLNRHRVTDRFWRAAQPTPAQLRAIARHGIRTIINLRGGRDYGSWPLERDACAAAGLSLKEFVLRSREAPDKETLFAARDLLADLEYPVLVHCKSGADRAGFMAALFLLIAENEPVAEAKRQLSARYGHFRFAKTGILDAFLDLYEREGEAKGIDFFTWVEEHYDPEALKRDFKTRFWSDMMVDRLLNRE
ncbi:conserved hypothetical protein [Hyphomicrobiales bacterium]|nr:conserved hypothetical protein [Hyphomicrobiales bacterium]CAH1676473.1 conserved hypothetical protein [Hyphomicrobiales bacterium]